MSIRSHMPAFKRSVGGFTLVELLVGLVLGLLVIGAASGIFLSSRQVYSTTESLGRVQENARAAFELMARDIREAGGNGCNSQMYGANITNVLKNPTSNEYTNFRGGIIGYTGTQAGIPFGTAARQRVAGTEAIVLKSGTDSGIRIDPDNSSNVNIGTFEPVPADFLRAIVLVCDPQHAAIFQVTAIDSSPNHGVKIQTSGNISPGNETNCLAPGGNCPNGNKKRYSFGCTDGWWEGGTKGNSNRPDGCLFDGAPPAVLAKLTSVTWFIGNGSKTGRSLYRRVDGPSAEADEIAEHVTALRFEYLLSGATSYVPASSITTDDDWAQVTAVRMLLTFEGEDRTAGVGTDPLRRELASTVALRNRLP